MYEMSMYDSEQKSVSIIFNKNSITMESIV